MIQEHDVVITRKAFPADFVWGLQRLPIRLKERFMKMDEV